MNIKTLLSVVAVLLILSLPLWIRPYQVLGDSMFPSLHSGDIVIVDTVSLNLVAPKRGEFIVFKNPHKKDIEQIDVKRVMGLPGEDIQVLPDRVLIDGIVYGTSTAIGRGDNKVTFEMQLGPQDYFVLGDDRRDSSDSRLFGALQKEDFIGRVILSI